MAQRAFTAADLAFEVGAYLADLGQSLFDDMSHSMLENLFDAVRCKLNRVACEAKCSMIGSARIKGNIATDHSHWVDKATSNGVDAFEFCGISDDESDLRTTPGLAPTISQRSGKCRRRKTSPRRRRGCTQKLCRTVCMRCRSWAR